MSYRNIAIIGIGALAIAGAGPAARAHFLWAAIDAEGGDRGRVVVIFEERPEAGDGAYFDSSFGDGFRTWARSTDAEEDARLELSDVAEDGVRYLAGRLPVAAPRSVECASKFGVYRYGETDALLYYYAKCLDVEGPGDLRRLGRSPHLDLDLVPRATEGGLELTVLWRGEPAPGAPVFATGPDGRRQGLTTDASGVASCRAGAEGRWAFRTAIVEPGRPGRDDGRAYEQVRHTSTLILELPVGETR